MCLTGLSVSTILVSATSLQLLIRILWKLLGIKDTICRWAYQHEIMLFFLCRNFSKYSCKLNSPVIAYQTFTNLIGMKNTICSCTYRQKNMIFIVPVFPILNLEISQIILVSAKWKLNNTSNCRSSHPIITPCSHNLCEFSNINLNQGKFNCSDFSARSWGPFVIGETGIPGENPTFGKKTGNPCQR